MKLGVVHPQQVKGSSYASIWHSCSEADSFRSRAPPNHGHSLIDDLKQRNTAAKENDDALPRRFQ